MRKLMNIALVCMALLMQPRIGAMEQAVKQDATQMAIERLQEWFHNGALTVDFMKPVLDEIKKDAHVRGEKLFLFLNGGFGREIIDYMSSFSAEDCLEASEEAQLRALVGLIEFIRLELSSPPKSVDLSSLADFDELENARYAALTALRTICGREEKEERARTYAKWEKERQQRDEQEADTFVWSLRKALASDCLNRDFVIRSFEKVHGQGIKAAISQKLAVWAQELCTGEYFAELHTLQEKVENGDELADWDVSNILGLHELMIQCNKPDFKISFTEEFLGILAQLHEPLRLKENARYIAKKLSASDEQAGLAEVRGRLAALREALVCGNLTEEMIGWKGGTHTLQGHASSLAYGFAVVEFFEGNEIIQSYLVDVQKKLEGHEQLNDVEKRQTQALLALINLSIHLSNMYLLRKLKFQPAYEWFVNELKEAVGSTNCNVNNNNNEVKQ